jgi:hypothetical protein
MKALFFTLLLLFIAISSSLASPSRYLGRQRIYYNVFTPEGVFTIELLYSPSSHQIVHNYFLNTEINPPSLGAQRITISYRDVQRWAFDTNPPQSQNTLISAEIIFRRPTGLRQRASIPPGVSVIDTQDVTLSLLTGDELNARPLDVTFVLMTIMEPDVTVLDRRTAQRIQDLGMRRFLRDSVKPSSTQLAPIPPLELDAGIWIHLLSGLMPAYKPGDLECEPAPEPEPLPNPEEACRQPRARKRGPGDQDDPSGQPESKLPCTGLDGEPLPDLNDPKVQDRSGQAGGTSRQRVTYDVPDAHVELQAGGFSFFPDWLMNFLSEEVKVPPKKHQWMSCFEVSMGHRGELRK